MTHKCEHEGCTETDIATYEYPVLVDGEEIGQDLCYQHAYEAGFCPSCGYFVAGTGDENWLGLKICYECYQELQCETGELDEDYDDYYDY